MAYRGRMTLAKGGKMLDMIFKEFIAVGKGVNTEAKYRVQVEYVKQSL